MPGGRLPRIDTELVILRVAVVRGSDYELNHHTQLGRRAGLSDADIERDHQAQMPYYLRVAAQQDHLDNESWTPADLRGCPVYRGDPRRPGEPWRLTSP